MDREKEIDFTKEFKPHEDGAAVNFNAFKEIGAFDCRQILSNIHEGLVIVDTDMRYRFWNHFMEQLSGTPAEKVIGKRVLDVFPHLKNHEMEEIMRRALSGEEIVLEDQPHQMEGSDNITWVSAIHAPLRNESGDILGVIVTLHDVTERKLAEEEVSRASRDWQDTFDAMNDVIWVLDQNQRILRSNKAAEQIFHRPVNELIGKHCCEVIRDATGPIHECPVIKAQQSLNRASWELPHGEYWLEIAVDPMTDADGLHRSSVLVISNVTERKRAEDALRASEELFKTIYEQAAIGIAQIDLDRRIMRVNRKVCDIVGFTREELLQKTFTDITHADDIGASEERYRRLLADEITSFRIEKRYIHKSGRIVYVNLTVGMIRKPSGEPHYFVATFEDISELKEFERTIRLKDELIHMTGEMAKIGAWEFDPETFDGTWTDEVAAIHDLDPAQATNVTFALNFYSGESREKIDSAVNEAIAFGKPYDMELEMTSAKGENKWVRTIGHPITKDGKVVKVRGVFQDITKRKLAEKENVDLLAQFNQAQKMESVGRLAGGVAHDFNNMLSVIMGTAQLALMNVAPTEQIHEDLTQILNAGERSADLTRQLLAFARRQTAIPVPLNMNDTVEGMIKMLKRLIGEDIDLVWSPGQELWKVEIDPSQIDQILANMVVNARDAIAGVGKITIETENTTLDKEHWGDDIEFVPGEYVKLTISDNGCGMNRETLDQIFEPFFTTKEVGKGTGLGLATVFGIVRQNKGLINVYSEPGYGTAFKIHLPRFTGEVEITATHDVEKELPRGSETILLVEDEAAILNLGKRILEGLGYKVVTAIRPGEALSLFEELSEDIHLLITDTVMPEMNGRELSDKLTRVKPGLKCLYMSGYTADVIAHHGILDKGMNFVQKPFSIENLARKVREALDR